MRPKWLIGLGIASSLSGCALLEEQGFYTMEGDFITGEDPADYRIRGEMGFMRLAPDGDLGLEDSNGAVPNNDIVDLGLDETSYDPYVKGSLRFGNNELTGLALQSSFSDSGTLRSNFGTIVGGSSVRSDLDFLNIRVIYKWHWIDLEHFSFGPAAGVDFVRISGKISTTGNAENFEAQAPVVVPGASAEYRWKGFKFYGEAYGIRGVIGELHGNFFDVEAGLKVVPMKNLDIGAGFRFLQFQAQGTDQGREFQADYRMPGVFFGASLRF